MVLMNMAGDYGLDLAMGRKQIIETLMIVDLLLVEPGGINQHW